jgi:hypothetical protein
MIKLLNILKEVIQFDNWKIPSEDQLKQEFRIEHEIKGNEFWGSEEEFLQACKGGQVVTITPEEDKNIRYRSGTESYEDLLSLIKSYRSYPKYRNEESLKAIYDSFKNNQSITLPIVVQFANGKKRVFSGNTRMDIAFQLGINPKVLLINSKMNY